MKTFIAIAFMALLTRAEERAYRLIVNPSNTATAGVDRKLVADAFLKKATRWSNGEVIRPVDLKADSPVRAKFSEEVLGRSVAAVKNYWQQAIFSGRDVPPPELSTDEDVVKYVLKHPGGIGYVSPKADVGGALVITVK